MGMDTRILRSTCDGGTEAVKQPEISVADYVLRRIRETGEKSQITNPCTSETRRYSEFESLSANVACALQQKHGFQKGDTVIYCAHDGATLHVFLLGIWRAGGIVRSSYPEDVAGDLLERIIESKAKFILCDEVQARECLAIAKRICEWNVNVITFGSCSFGEGCIRVEDIFTFNGRAEPVLVQANDIALILPTSGTTGVSKGAVYTHELVIKTLDLLSRLPLNDDPTSFTMFLGKQTHISGCLYALAQMTAGHNLLMMTSVNLSALIAAVREYKPRALFVFAKYLTELVQDQQQQQGENAYDLSCIHYVSTGGMIVTPSVAQTVKKLPNLKAFMTIYGMTECASLTASVDWNAVSRSGTPLSNFPPFSVGKLVPGTSCMVRDPESDELLGPGQIGELYFKSPLTFAGYLHKAEKTAEIFTDDGWIRSGDLGHYDEQGFVYVTDRIKETLKYYGNHISPTEIENVLLGHEGVGEVCVIGVPDPNGAEMIPRAFVVLKKLDGSYKHEEEGLANKILKYTNSHLLSYKQLRGGLFIVPALPMGKSGKVRRDALKHWKPEVHSFAE